MTNSSSLSFDTPPQRLKLSSSATEEEISAPSRARSGRLPLPRRVLDLTSSEDPALDLVNAFIDRLAELPLATWIDIGRSIAAGQPPINERSVAWATLTDVISARELGVAAWYVRDGVETAAFVAQSTTRRLSSKERLYFAAVHGAAEEAALAVLSRAYIRATDFETLTSPFRALVPSSAPVI